MTETSLPKTYDFDATEAAPVPCGGKTDYFKPANDPNQPGHDPSTKPFVISIPPPNVTGELHLGHAMFVSMEDLMIRYHRMKGIPTLWVPGTDHAGIATQLQVEKALAKEGLSREQIGREEFLKRTWAWKEKYGGIITRQIRRLGASCDWDRERFTLDEGLSQRRARGLRTPVRKRPDLPRPAHDQLVARAAHGRLRPGSGIFAGTRQAVFLQICPGR